MRGLQTEMNLRAYVPQRVVSYNLMPIHDADEKNLCVFFPPPTPGTTFEWIFLCASLCKIPITEMHILYCYYYYYSKSQ